MLGLELCTSTFPFELRSNGIHEGLFDFVEEENSGDEEGGGDGERHAEGGPRDVAAEEDGPEGFDGSGHGVELDDPAVFFRDLGERVDDRGSIHRELDAETHKEREVAVFGGERGNDDAGAEAEGGHEGQEHGREQGDHRPVRVDVRSGGHVVGPESEEEEELDRELDKVRNDDRERDNEPWEIDFPKHPRVAGERGRSLVEAGREVVPRRGPGEVEEHRRETAGGDLCHPCEDDREDDRREQGLDEKPDRAEDGLLVNRHKVAPDKHPQQVAVVPDVAQAEIPPAGLGHQVKVPVVVRGKGSRVEGHGKAENGEWRMENGEWRMENGRRRSGIGDQEWGRVFEHRTKHSADFRTILA